MKRLPIVLALLVSISTWAAAPIAGPSVYLEEMTWPELRDAIATGRTTVIIPVGGTEQNGPHMVFGKHNVRVHVLAGRIAEQLGNALVAPVISYVPEGRIDPAEGHMRFPGTISVSDAAFKAVVEGAARSFRHAGFRDVVLIGDHGGYQGDLAAVAGTLNREGHGGAAHVHFIAEYYRASTDPYAALLRQHGITTAQIGSHAGTADTSLALAVDPALVRADRLGTAPSPGDGSAGDARASTAALGQLGVDLIVARSVAAIRQAVAR